MSNRPVIAGFHACNNLPMTGRDRDIIRMTDAGAVTFLTGMGQKFSVDDVKWVRSINDGCHFFLREYLDPNRIGDKRNRSTWDYDALYDYFDDCKHTLEKYSVVIPRGQLHFQLFNEPNMPTWAQWEGFGRLPGDMMRFNEWFVRGVRSLRTSFPDVRFGLTPLTPGNRDVWFKGDTVRVSYYLHGARAADAPLDQRDIEIGRETCLCKEAIDIADEYYFHVYIHKDQEPIDSPAYGLRHETYMRFLPKKPFWLLECGYPNATMWRGNERLLNWFKLLDTREVRPDGVTFWILGEKKDWGNVFSPGGVIRPFVYDLKKYLNEREEAPVAIEPKQSPVSPNEFEIFNQQTGWTVQRFASYLKCWKPFAEITEVFIHHTVIPTPETWRGRESILVMKRVYEIKGWTAGPHIFVAPDGIWVFTPPHKQGVGCTGHNTHAIHVEIVGNYESNELKGDMLRKSIDTFAAICEWLNYDPMNLYLHRDFANTKCPGKNIDSWFKSAVFRAILIRETAKRIGTESIRINESAALYKYAHDMNFGAPLTNEFSFSSRYVVQGFATCILSCVKGNWENMTPIMW